MTAGRDTNFFAVALREHGDRMPRIQRFAFRTLSAFWRATHPAWLWLAACACAAWGFHEIDSGRPFGVIVPAWGVLVFGLCGLVSRRTRIEIAEMLDRVESAP